MSVPTRAEAAAIVVRLAPPEWLVRHSSAVAEICSFMCTAMVRRGVELDQGLAEGAALLHDVDKMLAAEDPLKPLGHAHAGAQWARANGFPEIATVVELHPVMELGHAPNYEEWAERAGLEGRIVAYADKRAKQELVALDERFAEWHARYPESPPLFIAQERAHRLERELCALAGLAPEDVRREPWVAETMRAAA